LDLVEYASFDGLGLAELVRKKKVTAKRLAKLMLEGIEKVNPQINAVIDTYSDRLGALEGEGDHDVGAPFAGVPFLLKDIGATDKGKPQEMGSRLMRGNIATEDSFLTDRFRRAGLKLLGRTTSPEFALASTTESILRGATRNPWDLDKTTGGSSGGAAAAVAAGILPITHGSDGGGSIRIPASACGVVGLKPSRGRVTMGPSQAEGWGGLIQEFVICRSVRDAAFMLDAVSEPAPGDPFIIIPPNRPFSQEISVPTGKLRIASTTSSWRPDVPVQPDVARCVTRVADECEKMGHEVVEASPSWDYEEYLAAYSVMIALGFDALVDAAADSMHRSIGEGTLEPVVLAAYRFAKRLTSKDIAKADEVLNRLRRSFGTFFQKYDILLTPTLSQLPGPIGKYSTERADLDFIAYNRLTDEINMHTPPSNVTGQPAISLPLGISSSGLPIGVQFIARFGREATLIRLASEFEKSMPWNNLIPPTHVSR
jgi:amidase